MKHFNLKTLTLAATIAGSLFAGNVHAQEDLGLGDVAIVTLRYQDQNRYSGINGGTGWDKQYNNLAGFGSPNGGNGRIGLVRKDDTSNQYYIACQGKYMKIVDEKCANATSKEDATPFYITKSESDNKTYLIFSTQEDGGSYLSGVLFEPTSTKPSKGYELNTWSNYDDILVKDESVTINDTCYTSAVFPYKVQKPTNGKMFIFTEENNEIKASLADEVDAGVPFLYVGGADDRLIIPQKDQDYKDISTTNVLSGFYISLPNREDSLHSTAYALRKKSGTDNTLGYYTDSGFNNDTPANCGYISKETAERLKATAFELEFGTDKSSLTVKIISAETGLINECVKLATKLKELKKQDGTDTGKYDITNSLKLEDSEKTYWDNNALDDYDDAADNFYTTNASSKEELTKLKSALESILHKVLETNVHDLAEVQIVTLQWNGNGNTNYSGINGGTDWQNPGSFGNPWGGNGRIGLVRKTEETATNRYYIACQGQFLKIDENGKSSSSTNDKEDATAFITIRSSENGLTFVTDDWKYYLTGATMSTSTEAQTSDYQINTWGKNNDKDNGNAQATNVRVSDNATTYGDYKYASITLPYQVKKPTGNQYHAFLLSQTSDGITASEPEDGIIPAGAPFLFVYPSSEGNVYMPIPQEDQEYSENVKDNVLKGFYMPLNKDSKEHDEAYSLSTKDGKVGYFLGGRFGGDDTAANRGYIDAETADELNAAAFELVYENGNLTVNIVQPTVSVTITDAGWATLYSDKALDFSAVDGLTAYTATVSDTTVTLNEVQNVPAGTGVVLNGTVGNYNIPVAASSNTDKGDLKGSATEKLTNSADAAVNYFVLTKNTDDKVQFALLAENAAIPAGKAYLELPKGEGARVLSVVFEGETTGIVDANRESAADGRIYNLNGQSVAQPAKGLYIVNGKKVVLK